MIKFLYTDRYPDPASLRHSLRTHLNAYVIADKYDIPDLEAYAFR
jgi:hypothetical protein